MNPPTFYGSKVEEYPEEFIDEIYKLLYVMGLTTGEKVEISTYQLKGVSQTWNVQCRNNRSLSG
ncbi:hypothetical protein, partial [Acinetobacter baumannii]|uniref:hypothetical protein n=1 Tax=Acinetobacter baumannii TaxID=470 RepID=UPI003397996F